MCDLIKGSHSHWLRCHSFSRRCMRKWCIHFVAFPCHRNSSPWSVPNHNNIEHWFDQLNVAVVSHISCLCVHISQRKRNFERLESILVESMCINSDSENRRNRFVDLIYNISQVNWMQISFRVQCAFHNVLRSCNCSKLHWINNNLVFSEHIHKHTRSHTNTFTVGGASYAISIRIFSFI